MKNRLFITCPKGVELLLEDEVQTLGLDSIQQSVGGIFAEGDLAAVYRVCLWSRLANRVIWLLAEAEVRTKEDLYRSVRDVYWPGCFALNKTFSVDFKGTNRFIKHSNYGGQLVKDGIVDAFNAEVGERPNVDSQSAQVHIFASVKRNRFMVGVDMAGGSLHRRGYRLAGAKAPLKENLAAALLVRAGVKTGEIQPVVDPMCGSGTLLIEAILTMLNIAPAIQRPSFGFEQILRHQPALWKEIYQDAVDKRDAAFASEARLIAYGYDADGRSIMAARDNATRAGVAEFIEFKPQSLKDFAPALPEPGVLVCNPPYGERLSDRNQLFGLYQLLGQKLRQHCEGWEAAILSSDDDLIKALGLQKSRAYQFMNGALKAQWVLFKLYRKDKTLNPPAELAPSVKISEGNVWEKSAARRNNEQAVSTPSENAVDGPQSERFKKGVDMVSNRLRKNRKHLKKWLKRADTDAYRIYDADMPEYAFALDCYGEFFQITEYSAPKSVDKFAAFSRRQQFEEAVREVFELTPGQLFFKERTRQKGTSQYVKLDDSKAFFRVQEGNAHLLVNLKDYLDTGLFLDHRPVRKMIGEQAKGKRFLNLFAYTSAATVQAAQGGALASVSVDMSQTYQSWSLRNFKANRLDLKRHLLVRANVIDWLSEARDQFDLIFLDPPSFSNSKRMDDTFDVQRDHVNLIHKTMGRLNQEGTLIFSNNRRGFRLDKVLESHFDIQDITAKTIDEDFKRNAKIHQCWIISHKK
ncbi:Ribosomal RNA large subunit methyltransferase K/L [BD1-7 clade bacterium]|uniref:Ribosomal RNA large subunit methyltransferase K/L n=1 Tax=BD1-7 clade bacterium TaxID=2029982 RepID=A0A5S9PU98_9GAMM|nr:Ribosomal RNA large subunit methyltransferase K/L [BD1-7 clade bacterium]